MNPNPPNELPYQEQVQFSGEIMPAFREANEPCQENDIVLIFEGNEGLLAFAAGFRNMGMFIGIVMAMGAPIGFGKVLYLINDKAFVHYSTFPIDESQDTNHVGESIFDGN